jgi:hypothetical protein
MKNSGEKNETKMEKATRKHTKEEIYFYNACYLVKSKSNPVD